MNTLKALASVLVVLALAACQTTTSAPQPVDLAKLSGTYDAKYKWIGYQVHGQCTEHFTVAVDGITTVTGTCSDTKGRSSNQELRGTIDAATGKVDLVQVRPVRATLTGYVREQNGKVTITGTITMGPDQANYTAESG